MGASLVLRPCLPDSGASGPWRLPFLRLRGLSLTVASSCCSPDGSVSLTCSTGPSSSGAFSVSDCASPSHHGVSSGSSSGIDERISNPNHTITYLKLTARVNVALCFGGIHLKQRDIVCLASHRRVHSLLAGPVLFRHMQSGCILCFLSDFLFFWQRRLLLGSAGGADSATSFGIDLSCFERLRDFFFFFFGDRVT